MRAISRLTASTKQVLRLIGGGWPSVRAHQAAEQLHFFLLLHATSRRRGSQDPPRRGIRPERGWGWESIYCRCGIHMSQFMSRRGGAGESIGTQAWESRGVDLFFAGARPARLHSPPYYTCIPCVGVVASSTDRSEQRGREPRCTSEQLLGGKGWFKLSALRGWVAGLLERYLPWPVADLHKIYFSRRYFNGPAAECWACRMARD